MHTKNNNKKHSVSVLLILSHGTTEFLSLSFVSESQLCCLSNRMEPTYYKKTNNIFFFIIWHWKQLCWYAIFPPDIWNKIFQYSREICTEHIFDGNQIWTISLLAASLLSSEENLSPLQTIWSQIRTNECLSWSGSKPFDTLIVFLKEFENNDFEKKKQKKKKTQQMKKKACKISSIKRIKKLLYAFAICTLWTVNVRIFCWLQKRPGQTAQKKQSDQGLPCWLFWHA